MNFVKGNKDIRVIKNILILTVTVLTIYYCSGLIMPILFSGVIAILLTPLYKRICDWGVWKGLSATIVVVGTTAIFLTIVAVLALESQKLISDLPQNEMSDLINRPAEILESNTAFNFSDYTEQIDQYSRKLKSYLLSTIPSALLGIGDTLIFFATCPIYIFFMLVYRDNMKAFYYSSIKEENRSEATIILAEVQNAYTDYLKGLSIVILIISVLTSLGLLLLGINSPLFLGILAGLLALVPYIGVIASAIIPILMALLFKDSGWYVLGVMGLFAFVQFAEGNFITPKIVGDKVDINPLMVIFGIVVFGAIGGIPAMIITIPLLALIKIVASHIPRWKPIELLLQA